MREGSRNKKEKEERKRKKKMRRKNERRVRDKYHQVSELGV